MTEKMNNLLSEVIARFRASRGYVADVAEAITLCARSDQAMGRVYHVGDQANLTEADWIGCIGRASGISQNIKPIDHFHTVGKPSRLAFVTIRFPEVGK